MFAGSSLLRSHRTHPHTHTHTPLLPTYFETYTNLHTLLLRQRTSTTTKQSKTTLPPPPFTHIVLLLIHTRTNPTSPPPLTQLPSTPRSVTHLTRPSSSVVAEVRCKEKTAHFCNMKSRTKGKYIIFKKKPPKKSLKKTPQKNGGNIQANFGTLRFPPPPQCWLVLLPHFSLPLSLSLSLSPSLSLCA